MVRFLLGQHVRRVNQPFEPGPASLGARLNSGLAFADTQFEQAARLTILLGSLLAAAVGIASPFC